MSPRADADADLAVVRELISVWPPVLRQQVEHLVGMWSGLAADLDDPLVAQENATYILKGTAELRREVERMIAQPDPRHVPAVQLGFDGSAELQRAALTPRQRDLVCRAITNEIALATAPAPASFAPADAARTTLDELVHLRFARLALSPRTDDAQQWRDMAARAAARKDPT